MPTTRLFNRIFCKNSHRNLQDPYHTSRFAPYVLFVVHRVANLRRSIRVYQTLGFNVFNRLVIATSLFKLGQLDPIG